MGYLSCNAESAIATCDSSNWDLKKKRKPKNHPIHIRQFKHDDLVAATNAFSADTFLGKGSHGRVYKAILDDGKLIAAVKRTTFSNPSTSLHKNHCTSCTYCNNPAENEIEILSRVRSPYLVNLIGYCADSKEKKLLVVEYMPKGSLHDLLHSRSRPPGWIRRVRVAIQVAKAAHALHSSNPPVIHRDIKSSNVLIDEDGNARLGDFGLALRGHVEDVRIKCTPPAGTLGYLDPGYLAPGDLSTKSDVFSFGILLLEIITGRNAIDVNYSPPSVVDWAVPLIKHGDFAGICDRRIGPPADPSLSRQLGTLAARCVRSTAEKRPTMAEVLECLKAVRKKIHAPPIWNSLRRRVERVDKPLTWEEAERAEEAVKTTRVGSRRNRKVSSVTGAEYENETIGVVDKRAVRASRSKSIGSFAEATKLGSTSNSDGHNSGLARMRTRKGSGVGTVRIAAVRLNKSRSMGVLQGQRLVPYGNDRGLGDI